MSPIQIFSLWVASTFGLMWIRSKLDGRLRCNWFTAGITAALLIPFFMLLMWGQIFLMKFLPDSLDYPIVPWAFRFISPRMFIGFGLFLLTLPVSCCLCVVFSHYLVPGFRAQKGSLLSCSFLFAGILMGIGFLVGILHLFGAALMAGVFGVGMRQSDYHSRRNDYY
ncbi:MAG TPA: hypothetical protein V6D19_22140 [Stenomitos sp.]